ncbi:hypothetical protein O3G_MSEX005889 [Manduca sexta]|uniref:PH domain-containing protein n=1 Tax=Manduca sexta TaxID=7130 RepID=A0A921Z175_MANSE|nr:hypothetical protein O3G_MSEX005889 [Manduca sexta]
MLWFISHRLVCQTALSWECIIFFGNYKLSYANKIIIVDAGLHMERSGTGTLDPKLRGSVFTIQTQSRTYHLEADCETEMEKWVDAICRVCGLRATEDSANVLVTYQNSSTMTASNEHYERVDSTGPYIPISECITGVRVRDDQRPFPFNQRSGDNKNHQYLSQPHIRINAEFSENESNISDDDCKSLNASQPNIRDWSVAKTFTKLAINQKRNGVSEDGPPVPPRPPKTFAMNAPKESFQGPKILEPVEVHVENTSPQGHPWLRIPRRTSQSGAPSSPRRSHRAPSTVRFTDDEDDYSPGQGSMQYCNLPSLPPAVDRASKPRHSSHSIGHINHLSGQVKRNILYITNKNINID